MSLIVARGTIQHGQIEMNEPIDLPDGSKVTVQVAISKEADDSEDDWDNSPEGIADWLRWYQSLEPLIFSPEEEKDTAAWLKRLDQYSAAQTDKSVENLFQ